MSFFYSQQTPRFQDLGYNSNHQGPKSASYILGRSPMIAWLLPRYTAWQYIDESRKLFAINSLHVGRWNNTPDHYPIAHANTHSNPTRVDVSLSSCTLHLILAASGCFGACHHKLSNIRLRYNSHESVLANRALPRTHKYMYVGVRSGPQSFLSSNLESSHTRLHLINPIGLPFSAQYSESIESAYCKTVASEVDPIERSGADVELHPTALHYNSLHFSTPTRVA